MQEIPALALLLNAETHRVRSNAYRCDHLSRQSLSKYTRRTALHREQRSRKEVQITLTQLAAIYRKFASTDKTEPAWQDHSHKRSVDYSSLAEKAY
jgi:hypothetical protein